MSNSADVPVNPFSLGFGLGDLDLALLLVGFEVASDDRDLAPSAASALTFPAASDLELDPVGTAGLDDLGRR